MNRKQAENILNAYTLLSMTNNEAASDSLREVILDAMTETRYATSITYPNGRDWSWSDGVKTVELGGWQCK